MRQTLRKTTALTTAEARRRNLAAVFEAVRDTPGRSRSEIATEMPFSLQTMTNVVAELLEMGLVEEIEHAGTRGRGNPHRGLRIRADCGHVVGIQIRWNAALFALADLNRRQVHGAEIPILAGLGNAEGYMAALEQGVSDYLDMHGDRSIWAVGVSAPLPIDVPAMPDHDMGLAVRWPDQAWFQSFFRQMPAKTLRDRLSMRFGVPVTVLNNPQSAALAEAIARPADANFVHVLAGMGLGVAYVRSRALSTDIWRHGGELGHVLYKGRTLASAVSAGSLRHALGIEAGQGTFERTLADRVAAAPRVFEDWLAQAADALRFLVNFVENAVWPEGVTLGGFLPDEIIDLLIARTHPLNPSVVMPDEAPGRRMPRLSRAIAGAESIPFGAAASLLSFQSNLDWPGLIAAHRMSSSMALPEHQGYAQLSGSNRRQGGKRGGTQT